MIEPLEMTFFFFFCLKWCSAKLISWSAVAFSSGCMTGMMFQGQMWLSANSQLTLMSCRVLLIQHAFRTYLSRHRDWTHHWLAALYISEHMHPAITHFQVLANRLIAFLNILINYWRRRCLSNFASNRSPRLELINITNLWLEHLCLLLYVSRERMRVDPPMVLNKL